MFHTYRERWEEQRTFDIQAVHRLQTDFTIAIGRIARKKFAEQIFDTVTFWITTTEVLLETSWCRKHVERRVGDEAVDLAANKQHLVAIHFGPHHAATFELGLDVTSERVKRFVIVIVSVEHGRDLGHDSPWSGQPRFPRGDSPTVANLNPLSHLR